MEGIGAGDAVTFFKIRRTCLQMVRDRGYVVSEDDLHMTLDEFRDQFGDNPSREQLAFIAAKEDDSEQRVTVMFVSDEKPSAQTTKRILSTMQEQSLHHAILITRGPQTNNFKLAMENLSGDYRIELFREQELVVNITEHDLVPRHEVLTPEGKRQLLDRYKIKDSQLPRIQYADAVARYYGLRRGDVVRIIRRSETAGRYVTYRLCV
ncbi:unnamed protein product [Pedinophyceae sp. YPF-701]|nr:unnamed protein product [Pedinophyceae sp. YPF-701]